MVKRNIIVIGASAGGFDAIKALIAGLPHDIDASIFIVWHMSPDIKGIMPQVLNRMLGGKGLFAAHADNLEPIKSSRIYIAPPDHHLILQDGLVRTTRGPKENRFRPAVDPLFRSAAYEYGERVIGVILSGALDDGSAGLWAVKDNGGLAVVQDPDDAEVPSMPKNAMKAVNIDYKVPIAEMGALLTDLVQKPISPKVKKTPQQEISKVEINIAMEDDAFKNNILDFGELTPYTCPECHGVLSSINEDGRTRFRCHTGHAFSADSLLLTISESIEESLWSAIRNIQESSFFLNHMGDHFAAANRPKLAAMYFKKANDAQKRANLVKQAVLANEQLNSDRIHDQIEDTDGHQAA